MKNYHYFLFTILLFIGGCNGSTKTDSVRTVCNPMDISYRYMIDEPSRREAADPTIIMHEGVYYLFASKSGGYWSSEDLIGWTLIQTEQIPTEEYAPCAISMDGAVYFVASNREINRLYKSSDPLSGQWDLVHEDLGLSLWDPAFFQDEDGRLYLYWGCSNRDPIYGIELDTNNNFKPIGKTVELIHADPAQYGWEVPGDYNTTYENAPWIEGPWMNKHKGVYYLQYAGPGTEFKSYSDAVYTSESPLGPFRLAEHNPFAYKPEGFAAGAGHGSTFTDTYGNLWHIGTITISQRHVFERRLGLYPTFFDQDGVLYSATQFGDYPLIIPNKKIKNFDDIFPGWMLLSYKKNVTVSSSVDSLPPEHMVDEDIRTIWAAESGSQDEWAMIDLGDVCDVYAIQANFADYNTQLFGREPGVSYQYSIESSRDGQNWKVLVDRQNSRDDHPHDYFQLDKTETCRFLRLRNRTVPGGHFAMSGFRVFGKGRGEKPGKVEDFSAVRNPRNTRSVHLEWKVANDATGTLIQYGANPEKLYHSYMVYGEASVDINSLNAKQGYFFRIKAFNENGFSEESAGTEVIAKTDASSVINGDRT